MIFGDLAVCESSLDFQILRDFEIFRSFTKKTFEAQTRLLVSFKLILLINSKLIYVMYVIF